LVDAETGESRALSRELIFAFFWAPDGRSIAYLTLPERSSGGVQAAVPEKGRPIAKAQHPRLQMDLWIVDVESGYPHRLFTFEPTNTFTTRFLPYFDQFALSHRIWSPLSDALVLPIADGDTPRIVVVSVDGRIPRPVAEGSIAFWSQQ
jgi:TolB protein